MTTLTKAALLASKGQDTGTSDWFEIDQSRIDTFAEVTEDRQFIHVDPARAAETPFGGTIAHGFLSLSLLSAMMLQGYPKMSGLQMGVNYGFDRVRFTAPVPVGARVRGHFKLADVAEMRPGEVQTTSEVTVEIEGQDRPALVALWLGRFYFGEDE
jgi:acyl dehydratase